MPKDDDRQDFINPPIGLHEGFPSSFMPYLTITVRFFVIACTEKNMGLAKKISFFFFWYNLVSLHLNMVEYHRTRINADNAEKTKKSALSASKSLFYRC